MLSRLGASSKSRVISDKGQLTTRLCASLSTSRHAGRDVDKLRPIWPEFFTGFHRDGPMPLNGRLRQMEMTVDNRWAGIRIARWLPSKGKPWKGKIAVVK